MMAKSDPTPYFSILSSQAAALLENGDKQEHQRPLPELRKATRNERHALRMMA
jgi:hypothetical protein